MPYRTNAIPPPYKTTWWERNGYRLMFECKTVALVVALLLIFCAFIFGVAAAIQFVVHGFVGESVGTYPHYLVAVFIFWMFWPRVERG